MMQTEELIETLFQKAWQNRPDTEEYEQISRQLSAAEQVIREHFPDCFPELDAVTTAYNARNVYFARWLYRRAFSDCLGLLKVSRRLRRRDYDGSDIRK